ncbi:MAG: tetratricopeptide repeat protein [Bacteroidota bacterium]|nr:tetratricopeptide repeat protein [Bacteroidota bacterium]
MFRTCLNILIIFFTFIFLPLSGHGSVKTSLPGDSIRIFAMLDSAEKYRLTDISRSRSFLSSMLRESEKLNFKKGIAYAWMEIAIVSGKQGDYSTSLRDLFYSYENFKKTDDHRGTANVINSIGTCLANQFRFEEAIDWYYQAMALNKKYDNPDYLADNYYNIGTLFQRLGYHSGALFYYNKSLREYSTLGKKNNAGSFLMNVGYVYLMMNNADSALSCFLRASENLEKSGKINDVYATALLNISKLYFQKKLSAKALYYCQKSLNVCNTLDLRTIQCRVLAFIAEIYKSMGKFKESVETAQYALALADSTRQIGTAADAHNILYEIYKSRGDLSLALQHLEKATYLNDSLRHLTDLENFRKLDQKYQTAELLKEKVYLEQKTEVSKNRTRIFIFLFIIIFLSGSFVVVTLLLRNKASKQKYLIAQQKMQIIEHEKTVVQNELDRKKNELMAYATLQVKTNESISKVLEHLRHSLPSFPKSAVGVQDEVNNAIREIDKLILTDSWTEFRKRFVDIHPEFFENLNKVCPSLTNNDLKIASLIRMNLNTKEIASITLKSIESINIAKYRLRKKMHIEDEESLLNFLLSIPS